MSIERIRTDIETDFMARFPVLQPNVDITGENSDFKPAANKSWVRMSISIADTIYPCINNDTEQTDGFFNIQAFTSTKQGSNEASQIVDDAKAILKSAVLNAISFLDFSVSTGVQDSGWFMITVRGRFRAHD